MRRIKLLLCGLAVACSPAFAEEKPTGAGVPPSPHVATRTPLNKAFKGRILSIKKRRVTIYYDFADPSQLADFHEARPPRLLDAGRNHAGIEGGRLVLEGSTSIRHKMESTARVEAKFTVHASELKNVGAVITEPVLSDFYIVYSLSDHRFHMNGCMHVAACGLREDEGAQDPSSGLANYRDVFSGRRLKARADRDILVEVRKDGWTEFFRAGNATGTGSSKGKTKELRSMQFGLFVHGSRASFDDLTLTCELGDEYLDIENLRAEIDPARTTPAGPAR